MSLLSQIRQDANAVAEAAEANLREKAAAASAGCPSIDLADGAAGRRVMPVGAVATSSADVIAPSGLAALPTVEIVDEWTLPNVDWLPPVFRGLPVVQVAEPMPFHGGRSPSLSPSPLAGVTGNSVDVDQPSPPTVAASRCPGCLANAARELGGLLFWEQSGPARNVRCVECFPPPMRKIVADLWLVAWDPVGGHGAGSERWQYASGSERWKRVAFAHLAAAESKSRAAEAVKAKRDNEGF